jgi:SPP1 gp7 family putative phage head morphogenesis protein
LSKWRAKAAKRGPCDFNSDIIPDWLANEVKAAMDVVGVDEAFSFLKQIDEARMRVERRLRRKLNKLLPDFRQRVAEAVASGTDPDYQAMFEELRAIIQPEITAMTTTEALRVSGDVGIVFDPAVINIDAIRWARQYSGQLVQGITNTTRNLVREATATFAETPGMTIGDLEQILEPAFGVQRSEMIAVTETTRAYSEATNEIQRQVNQTGLQMARQWHTAADDKVCPICGPLDGKLEKDWLMEFPDGPPAHPNCRCGTGLTIANG